MTHGDAAPPDIPPLILGAPSSLSIGALDLEWVPRRRERRLAESATNDVAIGAMATITQSMATARRRLGTPRCAAMPTLCTALPSSATWQMRALRLLSSMRRPRRQVASRSQIPSPQRPRDPDAFRYCSSLLQSTSPRITWRRFSLLSLHNSPPFKRGRGTTRCVERRQAAW